ncbi:MAG: cytochrome c-type biogenesis protein [Pseudomonadota bacterium]
MKALLLSLIFIAQSGSVTLSQSEEARAQALMREIRCVACENEPISQSASDIAENMRVRVRTMVAQGASDQQVRDWFAGRYGEFVLFRPKAQGPMDYLLWIGPFALLLAGAVLGFGILRQREAPVAEIESVAPEDLADSS